MYGKGLIKGLSITLGHLFEKNITEKYPEVKPNLSPRSHGSFALEEDKCISCGLCKNACPNRVIDLSSEKDENNKKKLTSYEMDIQYCLFCGLCVESCPTKALKFTQEFEGAKYFRDDLKLVLKKAEGAKEESGNV